MKGIILAGGKGTRMLPATRVTNKHMLPVLNKPMILYPLDTLKYIGCTEILIVSGGNHIGHIAEFLGDGSEYGVDLTYKVQTDAGGIAQALGLARNFAQGESVAVILGDNIFENNFSFDLDDEEPVWNARIFVKEVKHPERFGVYNLQTIEEKPAKPKTKLAVTGLYYYPNKVFEIIPTLNPSARGELEITDINNYFLAKRECTVKEINGFWSDAGTPQSMREVVEWVSMKK